MCDSKFATAELCLAAVKKNGLELEHVPEEFKTEELCIEAVIDCPEATAFLPEHLKTPEFYKILDLSFMKNVLEEVNESFQKGNALLNSYRESLKLAMTYREANNVFSHRAIPINLERNEECFIKVLEEYQKHKTKEAFESLVIDFWRSACEEVGIKEKTALEDAGIKIDFNELSEDVLIAVVGTSGPIEPPDTQWVAFVYFPNAQKKIRYFTYEMSCESQYCVCEWEGTKIHHNYGFFERVELECFLGRIKEVINQSKTEVSHTNHRRKQ
jgi:hypothetical protein